MTHMHLHNIYNHNFSSPALSQLFLWFPTTLKSIKASCHGNGCDALSQCPQLWVYIKSSLCWSGITIIPHGSQWSGHCWYLEALRGTVCVSKHHQGLKSGTAAPGFELAGTTQLTEELKRPASNFSQSAHHLEKGVYLSTQGSSGEGQTLPVVGLPVKAPKLDHRKLEWYKKYFGVLVFHTRKASSGLILCRSSTFSHFGKRWSSFCRVGTHKSRFFTFAVTTFGRPIFPFLLERISSTKEGFFAIGSHGAPWNKANSSTLCLFLIKSISRSWALKNTHMKNIRIWLIIGVITV